MSANNSTIVQIRRGSTAQTATFTGALAELTVDTDLNTLVVHDGVTVGGHYLATSNDLNSTVDLAQAAFDQANSAGSNAVVVAAYNHANAAFDQANSATDSAQSAYNQANTGTSLAQEVYDFANTLIGGSATDNVARLLAQSAFDEANTKFNTSGGTITGDTTVTGNLTVVGTTFYANTENLLVRDNIVTLNSNVTGTPSLNAGIEVNRGDSPDVSLLWNESTHSWQLSNNGPIYENIVIDSVLSANVSFLQGINASQNTNISTLNNTVTAVNNFAQGAFNQANTANDLAAYLQNVNNTQNTRITAVNSYAAGAYVQANTNASEIVVLQGVNTTQNTRITAVDAFAQGAYNQANTGTTLAQAAFDKANTEASLVFTEAAFNAANTAAANTVYLQGVNDTQNTNITAVNNFSGGAFNKANSGTILAQAAFDKANTQDIVVNSITSNTTISLPYSSRVSGNVTAASADTLIDSFDKTTFRSAKYELQMTSDNGIHVVEMRIMQDGTNTYTTQYGEMYTTIPLGSFTSNVSSGLVNLYFSPLIDTVEVVFERNSLVTGSHKNSIP